MVKKVGVRTLVDRRGIRLLSINSLLKNVLAQHLPDTLYIFCGNISGGLKSCKIQSFMRIQVEIIF
jgi:hypothetical protein